MGVLQMEEGVWYDLIPPAKVNGRIFRHVFCEYQVPNNPDEFSVRGIPDGETEEKPFILIFMNKGVRVKRSDNQSGSAPKIRVVK